MRQEFPSARKKKNRLARQVVALEEKPDRLIELRINGDVSRDIFTRKKVDIENKLLIARQQFDLLSDNKIDLVAEIDCARLFLSNPGDFWHTAGPTEKHTSFGLFFDGPVTLNWANKKVGTIRADGSNCLIWLPRLD